MSRQELIVNLKKKRKKRKKIATYYEHLLFNRGFAFFPASRASVIICLRISASS